MMDRLKNIMFGAFACLLSLTLVSCWEDDVLPEEDPVGPQSNITLTQDGTMHSFVFDGYEPLKDKPVTVYYQIPKNGNMKTMPILFIFPGESRDADVHLQLFSSWADTHGIMLFALQYSSDLYPTTTEYILGGLSETDLGQIVSSITKSDYQRYLDQLANAAYDSNMLERVLRGGVTFAGDMWEFVGAGKLAKIATKGMQKGGRAEADGDGITLTDVTAFRLYADVRTTYVKPGLDGTPKPSNDPAPALAKARRTVSDMRGTGCFDALLAESAPVLKRLLGRVKLDLGEPDPALEALPTDERLARVREGNEDPGLLLTYFDFGRYLLIASSYNCVLPANLQGIWSPDTDTIWSADYHININLQMNYWLAETCRMPELTKPLLDYVRFLSLHGRRTAKIQYGGMSGWVAHTVTNPWGFTAPGEGASWGSFMCAGAWCCQHIFERYRFSGDPDVLRENYDVLRGACLFFLDFLTEDPRSGYLVTCPSNSPENSFFAEDGGRYSVCAGPTMDNEILRMLFSSTAEAARILGIDGEFAAKLDAAAARLAPVRIGKYGQIMEWSEDFEEVEPGQLSDRERVILDFTAQRGRVQIAEIARATGFKTIERNVSHLLDMGALHVSERVVDNYRPKTEPCVRLVIPRDDEQTLHQYFDQLKRAPKQETLLLAYLDLSRWLQGGDLREVSKENLLKRSGVSGAVLHEAVKRGMFEIYGIDPAPEGYIASTWSDSSSAFSSLKTGSTFRMGRYEQDNNINNGPESIEWQVLTVQNDRALVISKYALDFKAYNDTITDITWENASLRKWLNNDFYNTAFNSTEKNQILLVTNENPDNPQFGIDGGNRTQDRIFVLSFEEAEKYFKNDQSRICEVTDYAAAGQAAAYASKGMSAPPLNGNAAWWLRTPGENSLKTVFVALDGSIYYYGYGAMVLFNGTAYNDVRPAFWVKLSAAPAPTATPRSCYTVTYAGNDCLAKVPTDSKCYRLGDLVTLLFEPVEYMQGTIFNGWDMDDDGAADFGYYYNTFAMPGYDVELKAVCSRQYYDYSHSQYGQSDQYYDPHQYYNPNNDPGLNNDIYDPNTGWWFDPGSYYDYYGGVG